LKDRGPWSFISFLSQLVARNNLKTDSTAQYNWSTDNGRCCLLSLGISVTIMSLAGQMSAVLCVVRLSVLSLFAGNLCVTVSLSVTLTQLNTAYVSGDESLLNRLSSESSHPTYMSEGKAVPQHTYEGSGGRECIAPTHP
jgi:hypothetical protein